MERWQTMPRRRSSTLQAHAEQLGAWITRNDYPRIDRETWDAIDVLSDSPEWDKIVIRLANKYYVASRGYNTADGRFTEAISPLLKSYALDDCIDLIGGIQNNGLNGWMQSK